MITQLYQLNNGGTIEVATVGKETEINVVGGTRQVSPGDLLVQTGRPDVWDVVSEQQLMEMASPVSNFEPEFEPDGGDQFDPSDHTAAEVKDYLQSNISIEERERVATAERNGKNRSSAFPW